MQALIQLLNQIASRCRYNLPHTASIVPPLSFIMSRLRDFSKSMIPSHIAEFRNILQLHSSVQQLNQHRRNRISRRIGMLQP